MEPQRKRSVREAMLEGLDDIKWKDLKHAFGSAADVPANLRGLCAEPGAAAHKEALQALCGSIYHQRTVYEATQYAVPFLIEIARSPSTHDREGVLALIEAIAGSLNSYPVEKHLQESRQAIKQHLDSLFDLLQDQSPAIRIGAAHVIVRFPEEYEKIETEFLHLLEKESSELFRAGVLYLFGRLSKVSNNVLPLLLNAGDGNRLLERQASHIAIAMLNPPNLSEEAKDMVIETLICEDMVGDLKALPWDIEGEVAAFDFLASLEQASREKCVAKLIRTIKNGEGNHHQVATMMNLVFGERGALLQKADPAENVKSIEELTEQQRDVLKLFVDIYDVPNDKRIFYGSPCRWHLPDKARDLRTLLEPKRSWWANLFKSS